MWLRVKVNGHGECAVNFNQVRKITPATNDSKRSYISFEKGDVLFLDEPFEELWSRILSYGEITMEAAQAPLDVRMPPA